MPHLFAFLLVISSLFSLSAHAALPADVTFILAAPSPTYTFGDQVTFAADLKSDTPIAAYYISYQSEGKSVQTSEIAGPAVLDAAGSGAIRYTLDLHEGALRPFSTVTYWFQVKTSDGTLFASPHFSFFYNDNRFNWQTLISDQFTVHWVDGDMVFAQEVQNAAQSGLTQIETLIPVNLPDHPIEIYVYAQAADLQSALDLSYQDLLGSVSWVAGNASPDLGVVMVSIAPGMDQRLVMDQQIPHELAHVLTYQLTGAAYTQLPIWLTEGIASMAELYPNSDYAYTLEVAVKENNLIPIADLCAQFPHEAAPAFLAYAEADSFGHYLYASYGAPGLQKLIKSYSDGLGCSEGAMSALGMTLNGLDYHWKQDALRMNTAGLVLNNLLPYIILAALILSIPLITLLAVRQKSPAKQQI
jgi:hypothetical protein